ncbi:Tigger transposable element-derived protein 4, partial [Dictyocoela muelleri]
MNLQEMALDIAKIYNVENFKASNGWLQKFKARYNISSRFIKGEAGLVNDEVINSFKDFYKEKIKCYAPSDIFNCDETGLFYKCTPIKTLCFKNENQISGKFSKDRITILFCVSMSGEKLNPLLIGKFKSPRGFKDLKWDKLKISYHYNKKAWMDVKIFRNWPDDLNKSMMKQKRKILLTLDNAPVHPVGFESSNLELLYFPPGVTSKIQPLDQGIIKTFKCYYKKNLNAKINLESDISN